MATPARALVLTRDPDLRDDLHRLAVIAGAEPEASASAASARRPWELADVVVVGADVLDEVARAGLDRRDGVVVVTTGVLPDAAWPLVLAVGAEGVVVLPHDEQSLLARLADAGTASRRRAHVVGVVGGSGGAGASVLATALALAAHRRGYDVALVDADPDAAGLDLVLGAEDDAGARWCDLASVSGSLAPDALRAALPVVHGIHLLTTDRQEPDPLPVAAMPAVVDAARAAFDVVVLDLPRARHDLLEVLAPRCDDVLLVATTDVRGASACRRPLAAVSVHAPVRLVVRRRPRAALDADQLGSWLGVDVLAELADDPTLTASIDRGDPPVARSRIARTCDAIAATLLAVA